MSTTFFDIGGATSARQSFAQLVKRARLPFAAWSRRRRLAFALLIAALAFGLGSHGWIVSDLGGLEASRTALDAATRHLADARRALAQLPALRREVAGAPAARGLGSWSSADDVRVVSELAAQNGVALLALEPGAVSGTGRDAMRSIQLTARTDFVHLMAFLHGLSDVPVLVVPIDVAVKRTDASLAINATLNVYSALRPIASTGATDTFADESLDSDDEEVVFYDPFSLVQMQASGELPDAMQLRLAGLLRDRTHALALLETPDGTTTAASGEQIGVERVTRLDALSITLANGGGATRTLALTEAS
ncbi:hypothetical protein PQQ51_17585 [Paraburkholderia xenovorans]|uniref:hypothetical protein n=1 Tax=Paraburkholderia xenovorans TaxID=36873 RepID=UPI0038B7E1CC